MELSPCDFCHSDSYSVINQEIFETFSSQDVQVLDTQNVICKRCGLIFRNPHLDKAELRSFYDKSGTDDTHASAPNFILMTEHIEGKLRYSPVKISQSEYLTRSIRDANISPSDGFSVLEIGCYEGGLLGLIKQNNPSWVLSGIEPTTNSVNVGKNLYGIQIHQGFFEDYPLEKNAYDCIIASHVVEHSPYVSQIFSKAFDILKLGGIFYVEVPNIEMISDRSITSFFNYEHVIYFTSGCLANYFLKHGFRILSVETDPGYPAIRIIGQKEESISPQVPDSSIHYDYVKNSTLMDQKYHEKNEFIRKIQDKIAHLTKIWKQNNSRVLIYGTGNHTTCLLKMMDIGEVNFIGFVDSDVRKHGVRYRNHLINGPDSIERLEPDVILISSYSCQNEIAGTLDGYETMGIDIVKLYDEVFDLEAFRG